MPKKPTNDNFIPLHGSNYHKDAVQSNENQTQHPAGGKVTSFMLLACLIDIVYTSFDSQI